MRKLGMTLYILTQDSYLHCQNHAVEIIVGGEEKGRIPAHNVDSIICFGNTTVSTPFFAFCAQNGITLTFLSDTGRFYGRLQGPQSGNILLRQQQFADVSDPFFSVSLVKNILCGKVGNEKLLLQHCARDLQDKEKKSRIAAAATALTTAIRELPICMTVDELRGKEGAAAAVYFSVFDDLLKRDGPMMTFQKRSRRPPENRVNALLSFLYTLLKSDVQSAVESVGLDPAAGFLHTLRPGRPALALDLMEELRAPLCDRLALSLINRGQIQGTDFEADTPCYYLTDKARKTVLNAWRDRKKQTVLHPFLKEKIEIGLIPFAQAQLLARVIRGDLDEYPPFVWR
ncbi:MULTISPECIES: type I-C CRISPR-associated endonuclease Cas1c [Caproicibacterium]|uniref:CRISPR-associated endonuclease Cas1 n=1 Tax=Caproicibacterium argilliputei TaxID=3030016 RepID=A0AA97D6M7_9FIRM|nr:type I-C CRISPR-associated endonuclease Cas1c [Caproicibacterium argilliputei]WOC31309.1 type I-C CRISPR-associated endonuclease Cas1c [Caproicibacterium argilliputei]